MKPSLLFYPGNLVYSFTCMFYIYKVCFIVSFLQKKSRPDFGICDKRTQKGVEVSKGDQYPVLLIFIQISTTLQFYEIL